MFLDIAFLKKAVSLSAEVRNQNNVTVISGTINQIFLIKIESVNVSCFTLTYIDYHVDFMFNLLWSRQLLVCEIVPFYTKEPCLNIK